MQNGGAFFLFFFTIFLDFFTSTSTVYVGILKIYNKLCFDELVKKDLI